MSSLGRRMPARRLAGALVVAGALMAAAVPQAQAAQAFTWSGAFAESGVDGTLHHQRKLAVEHSTGNVLRTDVVGDQILVYAPNATSADLLTSFGSGQLSDPYGIAVDQATGAVYVSDAGNDRIARYVSDGAPVPTYTLDATYTSPAQGAAAGEIGSFAAPLAVDPATGDLLVADPADDLVQRYSAAGAFLGSFDGTGSSGAFTGLQDLAVDSTGDVVVVDSDGGDPADGAVSRVERFSSAGVWEATIGPVGGAANVAIRPFDDDVVVSGNQDAVNRDQTPTVFVFDADGSAEVVFGTSPVAFSTISGLAIDDGADGRLYVATDTSRGAYPGQYGNVSVQVFDAPIPPEPPTVEPPAASATNVRPWTATLEGSIDPGGAETTYHFEYGTTDAYGSQTAPASAGTGFNAVRVSADLVDLEPSTTYHFRIVADNGVGGGPVQGADRTFTTPDPPATLTILEPTGVGLTTATFSGYADTYGFAGSYRFSVVQLDGGFRWSSPQTALAAGEGYRPVGAALDGLSPGSTYAVQLFVTTSGGTVSTGRREFTTAGLPPSGFANPQPPVQPSGDACPDPRLSPRDGCEPPPATAPKAPSNRFTATLGKGRTLKVAVPGKGTIRVRGSGVRGVVKRPAGKRTVTIALRLTRAGRAQLAKSKSGKLRRQIAIAYRPAGGSARSITRTVTFAGR